MVSVEDVLQLKSKMEIRLGGTKVRCAISMRQWVRATTTPCVCLTTARLNRRSTPNRRLSLINQTVRQIIGSSHQLQDYQIIGGPEWLRTDRFDIEATAEGGRTAPQMLVMVRTLLADRFQLKMHPEQRELPVFRLTYVCADRRLGPELTPSQCRPVGAKPDDSQAAVCGNQVGRNVMALRGNTMRGLANQLGRLPIVGRPVIDATGLTDTFDIQLTWAFEPVATADSVVPAAQPDATSIFTALQEQLGLKLESSRGPVDIMVIDSVQPPSEN